MLFIRPLIKPPCWENGKRKVSFFFMFVSVIKHCVSTCTNTVMKMKKTNVKYYTLGTIISGSTPRAEACCRSCLNLMEERTANGDGCSCSFTLTTRKEEEEVNFSFEGRESI